MSEPATIMPPVLTAQGLGKIYRIWADPAARLKYPLLKAMASLLPPALRPFRWRGEGTKETRYYRDFHALRDISLTLHRGEAVGIIGRNGSGKSTLLQLIAGTLTPSLGTVQVRGRVAALLELGSGFNPEFTGRENVLLNAALLGLSQTEALARFPAIAAFAEIGDFMEQPVKTYSSGMLMRLAFAVAAHVEPDVLIVDEALSVGDARFQLKCARAIDRFIDQGVTLLFVSHDTSMVKRLCNRAILLEEGRLLYAGSPNEVTNLYSKLIADGGSAAALADDIAALQRPAEPAPNPPDAPSPAPAPAGATGSRPPIPTGPATTADLQLRVKALETTLRSLPQNGDLARKVDRLLRDERSHEPLSGQEFVYGGELGNIHAMTLLDAEGLERNWFSSGERVTVRMRVEAFEPLPEPIYALTVKNQQGVEIYGTNTLFGKQPAGPLAAHQHCQVDFHFPIQLMAGTYFLSFGFTHFVGDELVVIQRRYDALKLEVHAVDSTFGIANLQARITVKPLSVA